MDRNWKKQMQRLFALVLCVAMLLPILPQLPAQASKLNAFVPVDPATVKLPAYATASGAVSQLFEYDCGNGVENNGSTSGMKIVTGTTASEFTTYCDALKTQLGNPVYTKDYNDNGTGANMFRKYKAKDGTYSVYAYFLPAYSEARIIIDTHLDTVEGYKYEAGLAVTTPKMVMYGLSVSPNGYHLETSTGLSTDRENNGALIIIRMKDNSLFINDGGILAQMSEAMAAELLAFCRELTGTTGTDEKMVINTWFLSHAHDDHFQGFTRFININHEHFDLKNIMYNIDVERTDPTRDIHGAMQLIRQHYPDLRYYKPHTGEVIDVAGIKFHVLMSHEDRLVPGTDGVIRVDEGDTGTFRDGTHTDTAKTTSDYNDTSTVVRVTFENKVTSILYGDMNLSEGILRKIFPEALLKTDIMLVPHHGFDPHAALVKISASKVYLYTQHKQAIYGTDDDVTTKDLFGTARDESGGRMKGNFTTMFPGMNVGKGVTPNVDYQIYWGGNETAVIDINNLASATTPAQIAACVDNSREAMNFKYTGWTIDSLTDDETLGVTPTGNETTLNQVSTSNKTFAYTLVTEPTLTPTSKQGVFVQDGRYLIMSGDSKYVLSYQAASSGTSTYPAHAAGSLLRDDSGKSENTFAISGNTVFLDHSDRDLATWIIRQYSCASANGTMIANNKPLTCITWSNFTDAHNKLIYQGIELKKGYYGENNGTTHGTYWDTTTTEQSFAFFDFSSYNRPFKQATASGNDHRMKFCVESYEAGYYVFYYKYGEKDFRVLVCDEYGNWGVRRYCDPNHAQTEGYGNANADLTGFYPFSSFRSDYEKLKVRLYRYGEGGDAKKVELQGHTTYNVDLGSSLDAIVKSIQNNITVSDYNTNHHIPSNGMAAKRNHYHVNVSAVNTKNPGTYTVPVYYTSEQGAAVQIASITVTVKKEVTGTSGIVSHNAYDTMKVHPNADTEAAVTFNYAGETIDITVGMLTDDKGNKVDTSVAGTYTGLTVKYNGLVIADNFTLEVADDTLNADVLGIVRVGKGSTTSDAEFSATGVANIQLTASAGLYQKPVDLIFIVDLSSSMLYAPGTSEEVTAHKYTPDGTKNTGRDPSHADYHDPELWDQTRLYALEESLMDMVETLQRSDADVRIAISDFGDLDHYEFYEAVADKNIRAWPYMDADSDNGGSTDIPWEPANQLNFILGRDDEANAIAGSDKYFYSQPFLLDKSKYVSQKVNGANVYYYYQGKTEPMVYTGSGKVDANAFQDVKTLNLVGSGTLKDPASGSLVDKLNVQNGKLLGTNYDVGLETAYRLAKARQDENEKLGLDREIVCIFMSDGAAMQYNYFSGRSLTEAWSQYLLGDTDEILENFKGATQTVTDANGNETEVNIGANSFGWGEVSNWPKRIYDLSKEMHQRLANGSLDKDASGKHFSKCSHTIATAEGGQAFFTCLNGQMAGYWDSFFKVLYFNSNGDNDDIGVKDAQGNDLYPNLPVKATDGSDNYKGAQFRKDLVSMLRQPNYHTVQADTDVNGDGVVDEKDTTRVQYEYQTYSPYYYFYNTEGRNWWAEAIKGSPEKVYPVINRFALINSTNSDYVQHYQTGCVVPSTWGTNYYNGEVVNKFSGETTEGLALDGQDYVSGFKGLGLDIYTIGFSMASENRISVDEANAVLGKVCSGPSYQKSANSQAELTQVLNQIVSSTASPATGAYFTDTMGEEFDLSTEKTVIHRDGQVITVNSQPTIRVMEYKLDLYGERVGEPKVIETITFEGGKVAKSDLVYTTTTDASGTDTKVYPDIWDDDTGLITGKRVIYNANTDKAAELYLDDSGRKFELPAETFFWIIGRLDENQVVLEYQAHLTGSTEGTRTGLMQSYATNASAVLHYNDYLGHLTQKGTVSPVFDWATDMIVVDYGIPVSVGVPNKYTAANKVLGVHAGGDLPGVIDSNATLAGMQYNASVKGKYGTMEVVDGKMKYTPDTMDFPGIDSFAYSIEGDGENYFSVVHVVPATTIYYEDHFLDYTVSTKKEQPQIPVVVQVPDGWTNVALYSWNSAGATQTWPGITMHHLEDNWYYGYVAADQTELIISGFSATYDPNDPNASRSQSVNVPITLKGNIPGMWIKVSGDVNGNWNHLVTTTYEQGDMPAAPAYADANYTVHVQLPQGWNGGYVWAWDLTDAFPAKPGRPLVAEGNGWYTADIPSYATNYLITKDEDFTAQTSNITAGGQEQWLTVSSGTGVVSHELFMYAPASYQAPEEYTVTNGWADTGNLSTYYQDEDRPGAVTEALKDLDADSIYGYDSHYTSLPAYSYGAAKVARVTNGQFATAKFSFTGTGFDVISLTSADTGTIVVKVTDEKGNTVVNYLVDTYYGYKFDGENWIVDTEATDNAIYQVPVIKVDLNKVVKVKDNAATPEDETVYFGYGKYNVEIVATYAPLFDHGQCDCDAYCTGCYDFYLDAVRIYDPANDGTGDDIVKNAYIADDEYLPTYEELRNMLIGVEEFNSLGDEETAGVVFIDGNANLSDEEGNGGSTAIDKITKPGVTEYANYGPNNELYLAEGQAVAFALNAVNDLNKVHLAMKCFAGEAKATIYGVKEDGTKVSVCENKVISSTTDLYYDITALIGTTVVIRNSGNSGVLSITNLKSTYVAPKVAAPEGGTIEGGSTEVSSLLVSVSAPSVKLALASLEGEQAPVAPVDGVIVPNFATVSFEDELLMNIYFTLDNLDVKPGNLGLVIFDSEMTNGTVDNAQTVISGALVSSDGRFMVQTQGIAAKNMGDRIYFRVFAKMDDGSYVYSKMIGYSVKEYAETILKKSSSEKMKALVVAALNYGAAAQSYFGYRTDALVNSDLTAEQRALAKAYSADLVTKVASVDETKAGAFIANGGFGTKRASVSLDSAFAINYYLEKLYPADGEMKLYYWMQEDFEAVDVLTAENATGVLTDSITVGGIAAKDLNRAVYAVGVYEHNGEVYCTGVLPYSIGTYCAGLADEFEYARAMVVYGSHAKDYFG